MSSTGFAADRDVRGAETGVDGPDVGDAERDVSRAGIVGLRGHRPAARFDELEQLQYLAVGELEIGPTARWAPRCR